jgi:hypothetical protein
MYSVYALFDPDLPDQIRYIGKSINPAKRLYTHIHHRNWKTVARLHLYRWIRRVITSGRKPAFRVIATFETETECFIAERELIEEYRRNGHPLTNLAVGGHGGCCKPLHLVRGPKPKKKIKGQYATYGPRKPYGWGKIRKLREIKRKKKQKEVNKNFSPSSWLPNNRPNLSSRVIAETQALIDWAKDDV